MSIIHRHLLATFLRNLGYTMVGALVLFTLVDLLDHIGSFVDNDATLSMVVRYYLYKAVWIIDTVLPIAMLMATLFTVGTMARYLELTALFASGWSLLQVTRPLIVPGPADDAVLPGLAGVRAAGGQRRRNRVWEVEIHQQPGPHPAHPEHRPDRPRRPPLLRPQVRPQHRHV